VHNVDLRGHGDHADLPGPYTLSTFAADLAALVRDLEAGPAFVCGHSMGAAVAVELAHTHPDLVAGVVAVDGPWVVTAPDRDTLLPSGTLTPDEHVWRGDRIAAARLRLHGSEVDVPAHAVAADSFESLMAWDGPAAVAAVTCPVVALTTDATAEPTRRGAADLPHVRVVPVSDSGHWIQVEHADVVADHVRALVRDVSREVVA